VASHSSTGDERGLCRPLDHLIICIVEGYGEETAIRPLVRRIVADIDPTKYVEVPHIFRIDRTKVVRPGQFENAIEAAARRIRGRGAILVLLDSDDDCPAMLGPELLQRARRQRGDVPLSVVLAHREYEAWFLAAAESLRGHRKIDPNFSPPRNPPEGYRDAKGQVRIMMRSKSYSPTVDQASLTEYFDITAARSADSFDKCYRDIESLVGQLFA